MGRVEGKVAIITGASSGLGLADAMALAKEGAKVVLTDINDAGADSAEEIASQTGAETLFIHHDVRNEDEWGSVIQQTTDKFGRLDVLVNNAGIVIVATPEETTLEQFRFANAVMSEGVFLGCKYAIPVMKESGGGSIINISSIAGLRAHSQTPYTTTKTAVIGLTFSMAADHGKDNIRVNCIAPGLLHTPMTAPRMNEEQREQRKSAAPLGTEGTAWDVGWAAVFLASEEARWITGIVLPVEAGLTVTSPVTYTTIGQQARF